MYLLLPFINSGIKTLKRDYHKNIVIFLIFFNSIYYLLAKIEDLNNNFNFLNNGYSSMWLILLYIIGSYFGKYLIIDEYKTKIIFISNLLLLLFSTFFSSELHFKLSKSKRKQKNILINYLSPTMLIQAISLVMIFSKINIKNKFFIKIISFLTPLNFSAQLIHARLFRTKLKIIKILFKWIIRLKPKILFFKI